jgi:hypothetical protein
MASAQPEITFEDVKYFLRIMRLIDPAKDKDIKMEDLTFDKFKDFESKVIESKTILDSKLKSLYNDLESFQSGFYNLYISPIFIKKPPEKINYSNFIKTFRQEIIKLKGASGINIKSQFKESLLTPEQLNQKKLDERTRYLESLRITKINLSRTNIDSRRVNIIYEDSDYTDAMHKIMRQLTPEYQSTIWRYLFKLNSSPNLDKNRYIELSQRITNWCGIFLIKKILIIDYENYKHSEKKEILKDYIHANNIKACIIISKSIVPDDFLNICQHRMCIKTDGLTLKNPTDNNVVHLLNGHDDLLTILSYEICKQEEKEPIIYSHDTRIKIDLLSTDLSPLQTYNYKHILPYYCVINDQFGSETYYIEPSKVKLNGMDGRFDNYYNEFDPEIPGNFYLQKYLKYKNKYMQLKKLL